MARDVFPATQRTWIEMRLRDGAEGRLEVGRHLMSVYAEPLRVYYLGSSARWLGEVDDVVNGFFASRLARPAFVEDWAQSGMRLRRWLMNAFGFYLKERAREHRRHASPGLDAADEPAFEGGGAAAVDRAFAVSVVRHALEQTRRGCEARGQSRHWDVFEAHFCRARPYGAIAAEIGEEPSRCIVMARTVRERFRAALCDALRIDGAGEKTDAEILLLLGETGHER